MNDTMPRTAQSRDPLQLVLGGLAVLLHVAALWLVTVSGLLAPLWAILALGAVWLVACIPLARTVRRRDRRAWALLVPVGFLALWLAVMMFGDVVLGWTA